MDKSKQAKSEDIISINPTRITINLAILIMMMFAIIISPTPVGAQEHTLWITSASADQNIRVNFGPNCVDNDLRESITILLEVNRQEILPGSSFIVTSERIDRDRFWGFPYPHPTGNKKGRIR